MNEQIEVRHKGISIKIRKVSRLKNGEEYIDYIIPDYSSGRRVHHTRAELGEAKAKAKEICEAMATGEHDLLDFAALKRPIQNAMDISGAIGIRIDEARRLVSDAAQIIPINEVLEACRFWKSNKPNGFTPKRAKEVVADFLARQKNRTSPRRQTTNASYLATFTTSFGERNLHEITSAQIGDLKDTKGWAKKTKNDFLSTVSLLYRDAIKRG